MAASLCRFSWWLRAGKEKEEEEGEEEEEDVVLVALDDECEWSIGWVEPHAPEFQSDDEADSSFAVLVPCYRNDQSKESSLQHPNNQFLTDIYKNLANDYSPEGKKYMEQWLSSLENL